MLLSLFFTLRLARAALPACRFPPERSASERGFRSFRVIDEALPLFSLLPAAAHGRLSGNSRQGSARRHFKRAQCVQISVLPAIGVVGHKLNVAVAEALEQMAKSAQPG